MYTTSQPIILKAILFTSDQMPYKTPNSVIEYCAFLEILIEKKTLYLQ